MLTFFNDPQVKARLLLRLEGHRAADDMIQGQYWKRGKGCFIGCATHGDDPMKFEEQWGLPVMIPRLGEYFFEAFDVETAKRLSIEIIEAIPVGVDASVVWPRFWSWHVHDPTYGLLGLPIAPHVLELVRRVDALYQGWPNINQAAAEAAARAVWDDVRAGRVARATWAAQVAAGAAAGACADGAETAAWNARDAVASARIAAWAARDAGAAEEDASGAATGDRKEILEAQYAAFLAIVRNLGGSSC